MTNSLLGSESSSPGTRYIQESGKQTLHTHMMESTLLHEPANKKRKVDEDSDKNSPPTLENLKGITVEKILSENARCKTITIHGRLDNEDVVLLLEKSPFEMNKVQNYLSEETTLKNTLKNDIYGTYEVCPPPSENVLKATIIHPATAKHIAKYTDQERFIVRETPALYKDVTLPLLESKKFSIQWVYNILEKKQEADRIVFEDPDPETGFILLPDIKWDRKDVKSLYLVAIIHKHDVKSLRDLSTESLPLLKNILYKGLDAIKSTYGVNKEKIHVYCHYQPSYYHLHVHFTHIKLEAPGFGADRAHLLEDVIENIEHDKDFYKKKTLIFTVREGDDLYKSYKEKSYFEDS